MDTTTLIARLSHTDYSERRRAEEALVARGEGAVLPLIEVVETQPAVPALRAAQALARLGDLRGLLPVARLLLREGNTLQGDIIPLLAQWRATTETIDPGGSDVITLARKCREETEIQFLAAAVSYGVSSLFSQEQREGKLRQKIQELSPGWTSPVFVASTGSFSRLTLTGIPELIQALHSTRHEHREAATAKLVEFGSEAVPDLTAALALESPLVRYRATEALGKIGDSRAVEPLLRVSQSQDADIQSAANEALKTLARTLMQRPNPDDLASLILLVRHLRFSLPGAATDAAIALKTLARTHPTPALRGALKWLKSPWAPLPAAFKETRKAIEEATHPWKDLPLIADAPPLVQESLPIPATTQEPDGSECGGRNRQ